MVTKLSKSSAAAAPSDTSKAASAHLSGSVKDSAAQIWQAGLGAFAKAQAEGTRAFEALVKEGANLQRKTQAAAEEKITEATSRMTHMATDISSKASGQWDKLENIFEERVAKALNKLGVPSAKDVSALIARIDELNASVQKLAAAAAKPAQKPASRAAATKATKPATKATKPAAKSAAKTIAKPAAKRLAARKSA